MDGSSDRAQLLYKLIKPSLHPTSLAKGQSHSQNDSTKHGHMHTHAHTCRNAQAPSYIVQDQFLMAVWMWRAKEGRRAAAKWERMTQPWSLVRLLVMISLILLICSVSYQAEQAGVCLFQSQYVPFLTQATYISNEDQRILHYVGVYRYCICICMYVCVCVHTVYKYTPTVRSEGELSLSCFLRNDLSVCVCVCSAVFAESKQGTTFFWVWRPGPSMRLQ